MRQLPLVPARCRTPARSLAADASFITAPTFLADGGISSAYVTPL